jgi:hypothetical protein
MVRTSPKRYGLPTREVESMPGARENRGAVRTEI